MDRPRRAPRYAHPRGDLQRRRLLALVAANPGIHVLQAAAILGINWTTCHHHVRRLEAEGVLAVRPAFGTLCLFDRNQGASSLQFANVVLRDERNKALADLLDVNEPLNQRRLADRLDLAPSVVHRRLRQLETHGLVQRVSQGRQTLVFATEALVQARGKQRPTSPFGQPVVAAVPSPGDLAAVIDLATAA